MNSDKGVALDPSSKGRALRGLLNGFSEGEILACGLKRKAPGVLYAAAFL